ncbi:MAG: aminotransferase class V-fold PLP-dependent enzyme [Pseudomonadota bacterium]|nr:aminotransferase class V-fold PLP-dependent enzyme [Pseudomonadota bacterium]
MSWNGHYFGSGPSPLPSEVLDSFSNKFTQVGDFRAKLYELAHVHPVSKRQIANIFEKIRRLLNVPEGYEVLLVTGGARHQYEQVALNFQGSIPFCILESGMFSKKWADVLDFSGVNVRRDQFHFDTSWSDTLKNVTDDCLLCVVGNETADGVMLPLDFEHPFIINDVTSDLGFRQLDVSRHAMLFASMGKAFHASGMSIVIIRQDMFSHCRTDLLPLQSYISICESASMYSTPSMIGLDLFDSILDWMLASGGMVVLEKRLRERSKIIYDLLDRYSVYSCPIPGCYRSMSNICFQLCSKDVSDFVAQAENRQLYGLRGHRMIGGVRINLYHGVSDMAFENLCDFLSCYGEDNSI